MKVLKWIIIGIVAIFILTLFIPGADEKEESVTELPAVENAVEKPDILIDSAKINELKSLFNYKKDEFSEDQLEWITPKAAPVYRNENGIYCYFSKDNLRFVFQYHSDDWLFIQEYKFLIDDKPYSFSPKEVKRDNDETGITEWFDVQVRSDDKALEIVKALATAKSAKVKLVGNNFVDVKTISPKQLKSIRNTYEYFKARGNKIY